MHLKLYVIKELFLFFILIMKSVIEVCIEKTRSFSVTKRIVITNFIDIIGEAKKIYTTQMTDVIGECVSTSDFFPATSFPSFVLHLLLEFLYTQYD